MRLLSLVPYHEISNFNDASAWYLDLGERDLDKRIQAQIFQLFEADCYVMLNAHQLALGARIGYNNHWSFGPLRMTLEVWLESNAVVNWHPVHFSGDLWLYGSLALSAFGHGVGVTADAHLWADVFDPFHIKGQVSGRLKIPFHTFSKTVTLEWGPSPTVPALPTPLLEVAVEHFKTTTSWPLPQEGGLLLPADAPPPPSNQIPVVPLDSRPHVTFSRPVNDDALVGVNAQPLVPEWERIGDPSQNQGPLSVRYGLSQVALEKQSGSTWQVIAQRPAAAGMQDRLYGSWAPLPRMPDGGGQNLGQTKLWLWSKSAFDYTRSTGRAWNEWFTDRYSSYPCVPPIEACWDFEQVAPTTSLPNPWQHLEHPGLVFSCEAFDSMSIITLSQPVEGLTHALCVNGLLNATITLPKPRNVVKIPVLDSFPSYALFYGYDDQGNVYGPFSRSSEQAIVEIRGANMTKVGITTTSLPLVDKGDVYNVMGCAYVAQRNQLLFVESEVWGDGGRGSRLSAIDLNTNSYSVLGIKHDILADIVVTSDGTTAYLTAVGELLRLDLTKPNLDLSSATVVCSGLGYPQQIALDEAKSTAYVVDYYSGRLLRIDLGSRKYVPILEHLQWPRGLLLASDGSTVYISECPRIAQRGC